MTPAFQAAVIETCLVKMFNTKKHFCVCDFDHLLEVAGISITRQERAAFAALHCVDYADMPKGMKEQLATQVVGILRRQPQWQLEVKVLFRQPTAFETNAKGMLS